MESFKYLPCLLLYEKIFPNKVIRLLYKMSYIYIHMMVDIAFFHDHLFYEISKFSVFFLNKIVNLFSDMVYRT